MEDDGGDAEYNEPYDEEFPDEPYADEVEDTVQVALHETLHCLF